MLHTEMVQGSHCPAPSCLELILTALSNPSYHTPRVRWRRSLTKYMSVTGTSSSSEAWLAGSEAWLAVSTSTVAVDVTMAQAEEAASLQRGKK